MQILVASIKNRGDALPDYLLWTLHGLFKLKINNEVTALCVELLFFHVQNMEIPKTLPGYFVTCLDKAFEHQETTDKAVQILKTILGSSYEPEIKSISKKLASAVGLAKNDNIKAENIVFNQQVEDKSLDQLIAELEQLNADSPAIKTLIATFKPTLANINQAIIADSKVKPCGN